MGWELTWHFDLKRQKEQSEGVWLFGKCAGQKLDLRVNPAGTWHKIHGNNKSSTGDMFRMYYMKASNGEYKVKLDQNRSSISEMTFSTEPFFNTIIADFTRELS